MASLRFFKQLVSLIPLLVLLVPQARSQQFFRVSDNSLPNRFFRISTTSNEIAQQPGQFFERLERQFGIPAQQIAAALEASNNPRNSFQLVSQTSRPASQQRFSSQRQQNEPIVVIVAEDRPQEQSRQVQQSFGQAQPQPQRQQFQQQQTFPQVQVQQQQFQQKQTFPQVQVQQQQFQPQQQTFAQPETQQFQQQTLPQPETQQFQRQPLLGQPETQQFQQQTFPQPETQQFQQQTFPQPETQQFQQQISPQPETQQFQQQQFTQAQQQQQIQEAQPSQSSNQIIPQQQIAETRNDPMSEVCLACICQASTSCNLTTQCIAGGQWCGPFLLSKPYWIDAGQPTLLGDQASRDGAFQDCAADPVCSAQAVRGYMNKHMKDCNGDGRIDCDDLGRIHLLGYYGCDDPSVTGKPFYQRFNQCFLKASRLSV